MPGVLVVGASRGIGRAVCATAAADGWHVVAASRRWDEPLDGALALECDVTDPASCERTIAAACEHLDSLDALVVFAGTTPIAPVRDADASVWRAVLDTNVVGAAMLLRSAIDPLLDCDGRAVFVTSTMVGRPWPGLAPYSASRAALEELLRGARREHPALRLTTLTLGPARTGFEAHWDADLAAESLARWRAEGYVTPGVPSLDPADVAGAVVALLASPVRTDHIDLLPSVRSPQWVDR